MDGLSQETLAFLIDIQEHGANQLRALSADFSSLGAVADRISKQLVTLQGQLDKTATTSAAAGEKIAASSKSAATATDAQTKATEGLTVTQKTQAGQSDVVTAATDRLTKAQKAAGDSAKTNAAGIDAQTAATARAATGTTAAVTGSRGHTSALESHKTGLERATKATHDFGSAMLPLSVGIAAVGGYAIKMGVDFESSMERLHTQAGYAQKDIAGLEAAVLKAAPGLRRTPTELAEGLYHVASVGIPASDALKIMQAASIGANIGASNLDSTTNALAITIKNLHQPASAATADMAMLNEIVGAGNLHMEELVTVLGKLMPQGRSFGLTLRDMGAALDVMTSRGIPAQQAATRLGMTFNLMGNPSKAAQKALAQIGLSSSSLAEEMRKPDGLVGAVSMLKDHLDKAFPPGKDLTFDEKRQALMTYKKSLEETGVTGTSLTKDMTEYADAIAKTGSAATEQAQVLSSAFGRGRQSATILTLTQNVDDLRKTYQRLPEGSAAIKQFQRDQEDWEKTSGANLDAIKAQFDTTMTALGKDLAPVVIPALKEATTLVGDLGEAFQNASPPVKHIATDLLAVGAVIAPLLLGAAKVGTAITQLRKFGGAVSSKLGYAGATAAGPAEAGAGGIASSLTGGMIFGIRGPGEPGSLLNPIAVQILGTGTGGFGTGGAPQAMSQAERDAAAAEESPGGVLLPRGVNVAGDVVGAGEGAAAIGLGSKALTVGKSLAGGALRGGMIALGGMAVSDVAGAVVGGNTGKDISSIGSDAAIGAGLGSLIGPEGTVIGAVGGALVGGLGKLFAEPSLGEKVADKIGQGFSPAIKAAQAAAVTAATQDPTSRGTSSKIVTAGQATAAGIEHSISSTKFLEIGEILKQAEARLTLPAIPAGTYGGRGSTRRQNEAQKNLESEEPAFRQAGVKSIVEFTAGMEAQKRLPQGATDALIAKLEAKWPTLRTYLKTIGESSMKELTYTIENRQAVEAAGTLVTKIKEEFGGQFGQLTTLLKQDGGVMSKEWGTTLNFLVGQTHSKMPQVREAAEKDLTALKGNSSKIVGGWVQQLTEQLHKGGQNAVTSFQGSMSSIVVVIRSLMEKGVLSTKEGMSAISKVTGTELKQLGYAPTKAEEKKGEAFGPAPGLSSGPLGALGMRVPGPVGPDNVGVYAPAGNLRGIVAGGELVIANRHTEDRLDQKLALGAAAGLYAPTSVGSEVAGERRPHSAPRYAKGGFIADPGTIQNVGKLPQITADLQRMGEGQGWEVYGISGYRSPQHSVEVGGFPNDPHTRGEAEDVGINSQMLSSAAILTAAILAKYGLERPFYPASAHEINHVQLLGSGVPGGARQSVSALSSTAAAKAAFHAVHSPKWTGPGGVIGKIGNAALARATKAANKKLELVAGTTGGAGGMGSLAGFKGGGDPNANETLGRKMMLAAGWSAGEWPALQALWTQESGWSDTSVNPSSGAYGIPQALGHGHPYNLGEAAPQIAWGLHYIKERYGSPGAAEAHEKANNWYARGGRMNFAGMFAHGGAAHANTPTMAIFGDNGPETAIFVPHSAVPHMETGGELLESIGITPTAPAGSKEVEGLNPDNNQIEYHTASEWRSIRLRHSQAQHAKGGTTQVEDQVQIGRMDVGSIISKTAGTIDIPKDIGQLSATVWKKVVAAIEHTLKETGGPANAAFDVQAVGRLASSAHTPKMRQLTGAAIQESAKTILTVTKNLPAEAAVPGGNAAINQLGKLITDAKRSGNANLAGALRKDIESTIKGTATGIMQNVAGAPSGEATHAASTGVKQLQALVSKARANGSHTVELALFKDIQKTIGSWQSAINASLTAATSKTTAKENLKINLANLAAVKAGGGGAKLTTSGTDSAFLHEEEQDQKAAMAQMEQERAQLGKLVKQLDVQMRKALKKHHKAQAKAIEAEIREVDSQIGEVTTSIGESAANIAQLQIEFAQKVYEEVKNRIAEAQATLENQANLASIGAQLKQQELHNEGKDLSGLQEDAQKQGGVLTPAQVAQAQADLASFTQGVRAQESPIEAQLNYDQEHIGELTGSDRQAMEQQMAQLGLQLAQLQGSVVDQQKATEQLTEATKANSNTMAQFTGSVTYAYQGQQYVVGQTSDLVNTPAVGL